MEDFTIIIGADLVPTKNNYHLFTNEDSKKLYGKKLLQVLESANYRIFNLEVPLTDKNDPIFKNRPNLIAPTSTIAGIKAINVDLFTLANNHILDHNISGLISTMNLLDKHQIKHFGANLNLKKAQKPYIIEHNGIKVGFFYNCQRA